MLSARGQWRHDVRWAFWRSDQQGPQRPQRDLPDDVGLPKAERPAAAAAPDPDPDSEPHGDHEPTPPLDPTAGATPRAGTSRTHDAPLTAPARDLDRAAVAAAGPDLAAHTAAVVVGTRA